MNWPDLEMLNRATSTMPLQTPAAVLLWVSVDEDGLSNINTLALGDGESIKEILRYVTTNF